MNKQTPSHSLCIALQALFVAVFLSACNSSSSDSPKITSHESSKPAVNEENKNTSLGSRLSRLSRFIKEVDFACSYLKTQKLYANCIPAQIDTTKIELDNDYETIEIVVVSQNETVICERRSCKVWVIQTTAEKLDQFRKADKGVTPIPEGKLIANWKNVLPPIVVMDEISNELRHIQVTNRYNQVEVWKSDQK